MTKPQQPSFSYPLREPALLALLCGLTVIAFIAVGGLCRLYHAQQASLATRCSVRGVADLRARHFAVAVDEFRAALRYNRDSFSNQLDLAQALLGLNRTEEARVYLSALWNRQPENGFVNLELARVAAAQNDAARALRFYHNAIYAAWPGDQEAQSRGARLELVEYLLHSGANAQAQAELIALADNAGQNLPMQQRLGELFLCAQDSQHALDAFRLALKQNPANSSALVGAGAAAFALGLYPTAQHYLQSALQLSPNDAQSAARLNQTNLVLQMDSFRPHLDDAARHRAALNDFSTAGNRLKSCARLGGPAAAIGQNLALRWNRMKPQLTLRAAPEQLDAAMQLSIGIERQTAGLCGPPSADDTALLLIAKLHEEN